jgi:hypothetical protein
VAGLAAGLWELEHRATPFYRWRDYGVWVILLEAVIDERDLK